MRILTKNFHHEFCKSNVTFTDAHKKKLRESPSFLVFPYNFFVRDNEGLPTAFLRQHETTNGQEYFASPHTDDFSLRFVLHDHDILPYVQRWIRERWEEDDAEPDTGREDQRQAREPTGSGKRRRVNLHEEPRDFLQRDHDFSPQRPLEADHEDETDPSVALDDNELIIGSDEAQEIQMYLRTFAASDMMP